MTNELNIEAILSSTYKNNHWKSFLKASLVYSDCSAYVNMETQ